MTTLTFSETDRRLAFLLSEAPGTLSRESVVVAAGQNLSAGSVLGRVTKRQAAAPIPTVVGTGNGTMSLLRFGPDVQVGSYLVKCTTKVANGGVFSVTAPDGTALPTLTLTPGGGGVTAYSSSHLSFSITDATDFEVNDLFTVAVTAAAAPVVVAGASANGTMSLITLGPLAQHGTYRAVCTAAGSTHGGTFQVFAPDGAQIGTVVMTDSAGATKAFTSDHVNFTLTDGSTNFAVGDYFNIIVATHSNQAKAWTAVDGTQEAWGILLEATDATSAVQDAVAIAIARHAELKSDLLVWGSAVTAAQKTQALRQLATVGVVARS